MYRKKSHGVMSFVSAVCLAMAVAGASARPAHAYGDGCSIWSTINLLTVTIPAGWLCISVYDAGGGLNIDHMDAYWRTAALCNWRIDWAIYNNGKTWWRSNGPVHGCDHVTGSRIRGAGWAPDHSDICAELYNDAQNIKIDAACVGIEKR